MVLYIVRSEDVGLEQSAAVFASKNMAVLGMGTVVLFGCP